MLAKSVAILNLKLRIAIKNIIKIAPILIKRVFDQRYKSIFI